MSGAAAGLRDGDGVPGATGSGNGMRRASVERARRLVVVGAGAAAGLAAAAPGGPVAVLVAGPLAVTAGTLWPGIVAVVLLVVVILQDWLVALGLGAAQMADEALILASVAGLALRGWATGRWPRTPLDRPTIAFGAVALLAAAVRAVPPVVAALGLLAVWKGPLTFALCARLPALRATESPWLARMIEVLLAVVVGLALLGVGQRLGGAPVFELSGRAAYFLEWRGGKAPSLFTNHNALGHVCVLGGLLALGLALGMTEQRRRRPLMLAALACLAGLVVSASRESWLAAGIALAAGAWLTRSRRLLLVATGTVAVLVVGALLVYFASPFLRAEIARRSAGVLAGWEAWQLGLRDWAYRGEYRVYVILKSWEVFRDHLWLGTGPGRFGGQVALRFPSPIYETYRFLPLRGEYLPLDVFWSRLLAEFGLLGSACYGAILLATARVHLAARRAADALTRGLALGGFMGWVAVLVFGLFAPALEDPLVAVPLWAWAGVVWARHRASEAS